MLRKLIKGIKGTKQKQVSLRNGVALTEDERELGKRSVMEIFPHLKTNKMLINNNRLQKDHQVQNKNEKLIDTKPGVSLIMSGLRSRDTSCNIINNKTYLSVSYLSIYLSSSSTFFF